MKIEGFLIKENNGFIFLKEKRISGDKFFFIFKFRIIKMKAFYKLCFSQKYIHLKKAEYDKKNLTITGSILKKFYLDELPQLFNILSGAMTFVGPRPYPIEPYLKEKKQGINRKNLVKCGITGLVQINKGKKNTYNDIMLDYLYIKKVNEMNCFQQVLYDLKIIFKTIQTILEAKGL